MIRSVKLRFILAFFLLSPAFLWGQEETDVSPERKIFLKDAIKEVTKDIQKEIKQIYLDLDKKIERGSREVDSLYALIITHTTPEKERDKAVKTIKKKVIDCYCKGKMGSINADLVYNIYSLILFEDKDILHDVYILAKSCEKEKCHVAALKEQSGLILDAYYKSKEEKK